MVMAKRQGREKPTKIEQRKVQGPEWGPHVEQTALLDSPIYIGQVGGRRKNKNKQTKKNKHKNRTERARALSLSFSLTHSPSHYLSSLHVFWVSRKLTQLSLRLQKTSDYGRRSLLLKLEDNMPSKIWIPLQSLFLVSSNPLWTSEWQWVQLRHSCRACSSTCPKGSIWSGLQ